MCGACLFYCEIDEYAHKNHNQIIGVLAQRDPVSIRLRVSNRVEAIPPPPESGGALGGPGIRQNMRGGGRTPPGVGPDTPVCAQRVLKTRPRRALFCVSFSLCTSMAGRDSKSSYSHQDEIQNLHTHTRTTHETHHACTKHVPNTHTCTHSPKPHACNTRPHTHTEPT